MYCTQLDLDARGWAEEIAALSDKAGVLNGSVNAAVLNQAIEDASAEIDSYLVGHIALPLLNPSDFLVRKACDMTRFYLYDIGVIDNVRLAYDSAVASLKGVATGKTALSALMIAPLDPVVAAQLIQKPVVNAPVAIFNNALMDRM